MALKNDQYNQILREYDERRFRNKRELDKRIQEAYGAIPKLKELEDELISLSARSGRLALFGDTEALDELKKKSDRLIEQQKKLLVDNGYPEDYLRIRYQCSRCKDTGFIGNEKCRCFKQAIADMIYEGSNLKSVLERENFSTFSFKYYSDDYIDESIGLSPLSNMQKIVAGCKSFIRHFDKKHDNLLFLGNTGVGKTFLANCIAKELLDRGYTVIYLTAFRLFDILEKYKFGKEDDNSLTAANQFEYILDCDMLIIDDLGTELSNSFTTSQLYLIINERLLRQKSTLISTNLSLDNLNANYSERIYSRIISNYCIRRIVGEDIRLQKAIKM
ncbi:MAG TPA: ATP-binding protein [Clostridiales bacterium]|jgi:DNA replication protein DnaC|nr:ATP-binding protein [Clostridiales bacterium]